jgi:hypothetical protein
MAEAKRQHDWNVASTIMALMAEMNRDRKRRRKPFKPDDFNPYAEQKPIVARGTVEQAAANARCKFQTKLSRVAMSQVKAGGAYVELTARSAQFLKGLEAAQKRLQSFGASTRLGRHQAHGTWSRGRSSCGWKPRSLYKFR